jgi:hypothetical protein
MRVKRAEATSVAPASSRLLTKEDQRIDLPARCRRYAVHQEADLRRGETGRRRVIYKDECLRSWRRADEETQCENASATLGVPVKTKKPAKTAASVDTSSPLITLADFRILSSVILDYFRTANRTQFCSLASRFSSE